jgi:hypothetical protein
MKSMSMIGILLIIIGILTLSYDRFTYTEKEKVAEIGSLTVMQDTKKAIHFPPILGGLAMVAGIVLVVAGRKR